MNGNGGFYLCGLCHAKVNSVFWDIPDEGDAGERSGLLLCDDCHRERKEGAGQAAERPPYRFPL